MYTRICGQQQLGKYLCVAGSQPTRKNFCCKIYSRKIFSFVFLVRKYFHNKIKANYGIFYFLPQALEFQTIANPKAYCSWFKTKNASDKCVLSIGDSPLPLST